MTHLRAPGRDGRFSCICSACRPTSAPSRREFLCTSAASAVAASTAMIGTAHAQQPTPGAVSGRPLLIKDGCVLSLDRAIGDFEQADVLIEGGKIAAVRPNIAAADAEVIDAARTIVATAPPVVLWPSNGFVLFFECIRAASTVSSLPRSTIVRSASEPTWIGPLRGYMSQTFAGPSEVARASCCSVIRPAFTP